MNSCPFAVRMMAILQLCIAFSLICWYGSLPFSGELFEAKKRTLLFQTVLGRGEQIERLATDEQRERLARNGQRFEALAEPLKGELIGQYDRFLATKESSFGEKLLRSMGTLLLEIHPYLLAWLFLSITVSLMLLLRVPSALQALWLLPLIAAAYLCDNVFLEKRAAPTTESALFPPEALLAARHMEVPLSRSISEQQRQLKEAWEEYLAVEWAPKSPLYTPEVSTEEKSEEGAFAFALARLQAVNRDAAVKSRSLRGREPLLLLLAYLAWNLLFVQTVRKKSVKQACAAEA